MVLCMTQPDVLLTIPEVVERLAAKGIVVTAESVRNWARGKKVARIKTPSGRYYFRADLIDAIASGEWDGAA